MTTIEKATEYFTVWIKGAHRPELPPEWNDDAMVSFATDFHEAQTQWISVEDRLPDFKGRVIVATKDGTMAAFFDESFYNSNAGGTYNVGVTHWMPLPEPPKLCS